MMPFLNLGLWTGQERYEYTPEIKVFTKDDKELKCLLNAVKYFSDDIGKHFRLGECAKVSLKKGSNEVTQSTVLYLVININEQEQEDAYS